MKNVSLRSVPPYFFKSKFLRLDQAVSSSTFRLWLFSVSITVLQYQIPLFKRFDNRFFLALDPLSSELRMTEIFMSRHVRHSRCESQSQDSQRFNFDEYHINFFTRVFSRNGDLAEDL